MELEPADLIGPNRRGDLSFAAAIAPDLDRADAILMPPESIRRTSARL
jgi:hypothetical protein